jgi:hypothetical protein
LAGPNTYAYVLQNPSAFTDVYGLSVWGDFSGWIGKKWTDWWGKKPGDIGKGIGIDAIGRLNGAKCASNCKPFRAPRDKREIATELCINLIPEVQADILSVSKVLESCVVHCLRMANENCGTLSCPYQ